MYRFVALSTTRKSKRDDDFDARSKSDRTRTKKKVKRYLVWALRGTAIVLGVFTFALRKGQARQGSSGSGKIESSFRTLSFLWRP